MLRLNQVMTAGPATIAPTANLREAVESMSELGVGVLPVMDGDQVVGLLSAHDIVLFAAGQSRGAQSSPLESPECDVLERHAVADVMCANPPRLRSLASACVAARLIRRTGAPGVLVVDGGWLMGVVTTMDIARAFAGRASCSAFA